MVYLFILANSDSIEANDQDTTKDEGTNDSHIQIWYIYTKLLYAAFYDQL